ncbi:HD-domain/PDEase-like protein [Lentinus tigrinus ALCF2SS1-7]|uniref:HD-domain/PDEase-like protein n=1 Tax=Lentinus tigrinus ALCF2SS1-6 TaxID=1328759 RepID=A0A5C2RSU1_9APHY|nr:HD-domain/PDEase-like protein [Lentinus tigrinus ALCF2SS1-6]RPD67836.1 HD-domain/PDEase-like protein [Lentinus tigrinus ALCF2SS1-7]
MMATSRRMLLELDDDWTAPSFEGPTSVRRFKDSIHDYLPFGPTVVAVIDTPQFQRLRNIKQLGTSYYVWPGASHNRFEHCLGVAYLAQTLAIHLKDSQPSLGITQRDVQCVTIAGLCHDLGHGPWSHVWDSMFIPAILPDKKWCHEDASRMMFDALLEENGLELDPDDATFVKALIMGDRSMCTKEEKPYLFQIVANKTNGLDVDKFDYIARDSHAIDQKSSLSLTRLIYSSRVIDNEICYDIKDANQIFELCHTRMSLHKRIYNHKSAKAVEYMIVDALTLAEPVMNIARRLENPKKYLHLTDHIQTEIEASEDPRLADAQAILHRIRVRDLYKAVDYKIFEWEHKAQIKTMFTAESVVKAFKELYANRASLVPSEQKEGLDHVEPEDAADLRPDHVIIDLTERHHGMKNDNPLNYMKFYSKHNPNRGVHANEDDISVTLPRSFGELMLRVYTREARFFGLVQLGYREVLKQFNEMQERETAAAGLFSGDFVDPTEEDIDMSEGPARAPVTPPADAPALATPKPRTRALSKVVSRGRALSRRESLAGMMPEPAPLKDNPFTTVPANFNPQLSPQRKGKRKEKEKEVGVEGDKQERENLPLPTPTPSFAVDGEQVRAVPLSARVEGGKEDVPLDLGLGDFGPEKGSPPRRASRSPPRKKTRP